MHDSTTCAMINVELTDEQALAFRLLSMSGAWDIKSGSVTLHFDSQGKPVQAETRVIVKLSTPHDSGQIVQVVL